MLETQTENALAIWTVEQCAYTIEYAPRVIDDIRLAVVDAFFSLPRGGAEIGGVLLGRHEGRHVTITDYVPLDCEHATGPSFVLSPSDHARLADLLASARGNPSGTQPVGWYHSHTRSDIYLSAADIEIHKRYFPEPWQVALVLKPHTFQPTRAGFFFPEADGSIHANASYQEFVPEPVAARPLQDPSAAAPHPSRRPHYPQPEPASMAAVPPASLPETRSAIQRIEPDGLPTPAEISPPGTQLESHSEGIQIEKRDRIQTSHVATIERSVEVPSPAREPSEANRRSKSRIVFIAVGWTCSITLMFALGTLVNNRSFRERSAGVLHAIANSSGESSASSPASQPSSPPSLALHAKRQNGDLELNWNRESALMQAATSGVISIQDGESKRRIALDSTQVRGGNLLYSPTSDQIVMQLTVTTPAGAVTESVMVVLPKVGVPRTYPVPAPKPPTTSVAPPLPASDSVALTKASRPFQAPPVAKVTPSPVPAIPADSPPLKLNLDPAAAVAPGLLLQTRVPPPPNPVAPSPQHASQQPPSRQPALGQPGSTVIQYQPAVPIVKATPVYPPELQTLAVTRKIIEVKVTIDTSGKVTRAEAIPQKNVSQFLVNSAVNAARLWRFQPARRNEEPVSSETLLQFAFGR
jgi:proteasome lid subunit RPN8/RPN11